MQILKKERLSLLVVSLILFVVNIVYAQTYFDRLTPFPLITPGFYQQPLNFYSQFPFWPDTILITILFVLLMKGLLEKTQMLGERGTQVGGILGLIMGLSLSIYFNAIGFHALIDFGPIILTMLVIFLLLTIYKWARSEQKHPTATILAALAGILFILGNYFPQIVANIPFLANIIAILFPILIIAFIMTLIGGIPGETKTRIFNRKEENDNKPNAKKPKKEEEPENQPTNNKPNNKKPSNNQNNSNNTKQRSPGPMPTPTPRNYNPKDPPTSSNGAPPGVILKKSKLPKVPKKPIIPDDKEIFIDLSRDFNGIRSQDNLGACSAFAAASIFEYILHVGYNFQKEYLSPLFLYYKSREKSGRVDLDYGSISDEVMISMIKDGVCFEDLWEFEGSSTEKWRTQPAFEAETDASNKKIITAMSIDENDPDQWVHELIEKNPIYIAARLPKDFTGGYNKKLYTNFNPQLISGGHAMVIVGYHSHYPFNGKGIKAFKIRNSWSVNWGENGYTWVPAEILKAMIFNAIIITGWNKETNKKKFKIIGRAVFDFEDKRISINKTGRELFEDESLQSPDHPFLVGVIAQIENELVRLNEITVNPNKKGRFSIEFEGNIEKFEKLTKLQGSGLINGIDFKKLPAGVIVYKKSPDANDKEIYFHIVPFEYSFGGRGGEGIRDKNNKCSSLFNNELKFSGIPITFTKQHNFEANVIIPIVYYPWMKKQKIKEE